MALHAPPTDLTSAEGIANRTKLLRAWVEIGAWLSDYTRRFGAFKLPVATSIYDIFQLICSLSTRVQRSA